MTHEFWIAVCLVLIIEGIFPFINPAGFKAAWLKMAELDERTLRLFGLISMLSGVALLYWIN
ncbi:MAG: DUF2065 domain-containing protein [Methylococcales bacterium]|jgi:uncharacterized protein|nr:DUF2065 domain-containing protein [Methylococcales bacterium]MBT7443898.1 DUF2065 domain-containing protein [Methylococcales bacterium]